MLLALAGGVVSCLGNIPYYAAVGRGEKFATVVSLAAMAPLVTVLLAVVILRERLNAIQVCGLVLAGGAIWLFNVPDEAGVMSSAIVVAILPITLWGVSGFLQKAATNHISAPAAALVYLGAFVPMGAWYALTEPWPHQVPATTWGIAVALGFALAFGNLAVLAAFSRNGKASVIMPLGNLFPVISIGIALFLGETVGGRELAGIVCALLSVVALTQETPACALTPESLKAESHE
jgi:drug/metabolite transporter (DMT)-like permease